MKAWIPAFILAVLGLGAFAAIASPADAPKATISGVIAYEVDDQLKDLVFVFSDGTIAEADADACLKAPECKAILQDLIKAKRVKVIDVATGTQV